MSVARSGSFSEWDRLVAEHQAEGVGALIEAAMRDALRPVLGRVPNPRLVGRSTSSWNDELREDVLYAFAIFLLERGRLNAVFLHATDASHFRMLLRARARQFISGQLRGTELENKVSEACELLESREEFEHFGSARDRRWVLKGGSRKPFTGSEADLRALAWRIALPPATRRFRRNTQGASAVITKAELTRLLVEACRLAAAGLAKDEVRVLLRERLNLREPETISISRRYGDEPPLEDLLPAAASDFDELEARFAAADAAALLSVRQLAVLRESYGQGRRREAVAESLGISHGTVSNELRRAGQVLLDVAGGDVNVARRALDALTGDHPF